MLHALLHSTTFDPPTIAPFEGGINNNGQVLAEPSAEAGKSGVETPHPLNVNIAATQVQEKSALVNGRNPAPPWMSTQL